MANNYSQIQTQMETYASLWKSTHGEKDQTTLYRDIVPLAPGDFTDVFSANQLDQFFKGVALSTKMLGPWNCNHLFRDTQNVPAILLFSNEECTILAPLGEPGRDTDNHKASHLMCVPHTTKGPVQFNQMLPSTKEETEHLDRQINFLKKAFTDLANNVPVSQCGEKVILKATELDFPVEKGIQDFFVHQISLLDEDFRAGRPGYILRDENGTDVAGNPHLVQALIQKAFSDKATSPNFYIQGPGFNTQLLTHLHGFLHSPGPISKALEERYINVEFILRNKMELMGDVPLQRTSTPPPAVQEVSGSGCFGLCPSGTEPEPEPETDLGTPLMRTSTPPIQSMDAGGAVEDNVEGGGFIIKTPLTKYLLGIPVEQLEAEAPEDRLRVAMERTITSNGM